MTRALVAIALLSVLSGCGLQARNNARATYDDSRNDYKACLAKHQPSMCESQRLAMEADRQAYENVWTKDNDTVVVWPIR